MKKFWEEKTIPEQTKKFLWTIWSVIKRAIWKMFNFFLKKILENWIKCNGKKIAENVRLLSVSQLRWNVTLFQTSASSLRNERKICSPHFSFWREKKLSVKAWDVPKLSQFSLFSSTEMKLIIRVSSCLHCFFYLLNNVRLDLHKLFFFFFFHLLPECTVTV